jgi:hypothetical protein
MCTREHSPQPFLQPSRDSPLLLLLPLLPLPLLPLLLLPFPLLLPLQDYPPLPLLLLPFRVLLPLQDYPLLPVLLSSPTQRMHTARAPLQQLLLLLLMITMALRLQGTLLVTQAYPTF